MLREYDKVEEPCVRIHARMTTCVPDCRIKDSSRDGFRTKGTSRQLSAIKKRGKEETRREEVQGGGYGWKSRDPTCPASVLVSRLVGISEDFRVGSLCVFLFLILSRNYLHFSRSIQYYYVTVY